MNNLEDAIRCQTASLVLSMKAMDKPSIAMSWGNLGLCHRGKGDPTKALNCYEKSLHWAREVLKDDMAGKSQER